MTPESDGGAFPLALLLTVAAGLAIVVYRWLHRRYGHGPARELSVTPPHGRYAVW